MLAWAFLGLAVIGIVAFVLLSGGSSGDSKSKSAAPAAAGPVKVRLTDFKIAPSTSTVSAGKVPFSAVNPGQDQHQEGAVRPHKNPPPLPQGGPAPEGRAGGRRGGDNPGGAQQ